MALVAPGALAQDPSNEYDGVVGGALDELTGSGGAFEGYGPTPYLFGATANDAPAEYRPTTGEIAVNDDTLDRLFTDYGLAGDAVAQEAFLGTVLRHELTHQHTCPTTAPRSSDEYFCQHVAMFVADYHDACQQAGDLVDAIVAAEDALASCLAQQPNPPPPDCSAEQTALDSLESELNGKCSVVTELYEILADAVEQGAADVCGSLDTSSWPPTCPTDFGTLQQQGSRPPNLVPVCDACSPV